jgi:hypothetical protein
MSKKHSEEEYDLDNLLENETDPQKRRSIEFIKDALLSKNAKKQRILKDIEEIDNLIRTAMSLVLEYYSKEGVFNQKLLDDTAVLIIKRNRVMKKI